MPDQPTDPTPEPTDPTPETADAPARIESVVISPTLLGLRPYVLIEAKTDPADDGLILDVKAGGGIDTKDTLMTVLLMAVEELTGVPVDDYVRAVAAARGKPAEALVPVLGGLGGTR